MESAVVSRLFIQRKRFKEAEIESQYEKLKEFKISPTEKNKEIFIGVYGFCVFGFHRRRYLFV